MAVQLSIAVRNARLDALGTIVGASAVLRIRSGAQPATCATADSGDVLATFNLPVEWISPASGGVMDKLGTWRDSEADASGDAGHWRLYASDGATCGAQGGVGYIGAANDLTLSQASAAIVAGQVVTVSAWTFTDGNG